MNWRQDPAYTNPRTDELRRAAQDAEHLARKSVPHIDIDIDKDDDYGDDE